METTPAVDRAVGYFDARTVELYPDVRDRVAHTIVDVRSGEGSTVRAHPSTAVRREAEDVVSFADVQVGPGGVRRDGSGHSPLYGQ